jgi:hypothetical protein
MEQDVDAIGVHQQALVAGAALQHDGGAVRM